MIRRATTRDVALLVAITRASFAESREFPYPSSALYETWETAEAAIEAGVFLAVKKSRAIGACRFRQRRNALIFTRLCVMPAHRQQGFASELAQAIEAHAVEIGCTRVECSARSAFPDNRAFYQRRGYEVLGYDDVYGFKSLRTRLVLRL